MKQLFKAFGFLLLTGFLFLFGNVLASIMIGIVGAFEYLELVTTNPDAFSIAITNYIGEQALLITIIGNILTLLLLALVFLGRKERFTRFVNFRKLRIKDGFLIFFLGIFLNLAFISILTFVYQLLPASEVMERYSELMEKIMGGSAFLVLLVTVVAAPLTEEIMVRGVIYNDFKKATSVRVALLIQALVFGLIHGNIVQGTYAFILGLILGSIYHRYKTIWASILLHFSFNLTSTTLSLAFPELDMNKWSLLLLFIGVIGSGVSYYLLVKNYEKEAYPEIPDKELLKQKYIDVTPSTDS